MATAIKYEGILDYLGYDDANGRKECKLCGSSDGLHITPETSDPEDTGGVYCHSCEFPHWSSFRGTGVGYYAERESVSRNEAMRAFGLEPDSTEGEAKESKAAAPRPTTPDYTDAEQKERTRAWKAMNKEELRLREEYRRRRAKAQAPPPDPDAFEKWQSKLDNLFEHVLKREMRGHRRADYIDADTAHLE